jgi:hypothetical protein
MPWQWKEEQQTYSNIAIAKFTNMWNTLERRWTYKFISFMYVFEYTIQWVFTRSNVH